MIEVSHLTRRFGAFLAVDDISFRLERGEVVGFLGPNGAGKTTTMRMLTGFLPATGGSITIAGHDVLRESLKVRKKIGYLPEAVPLYREHRVEEMLVFQGRLHGLGRSESRRRAGEVLERVNLLDRRRGLIGRLSKGMRQRVGLAVALLPDPEVLILDEPTSGLDPLQRIEVRGLVRELAQDRTVLLSSHILPEIEAVCPRVIIMHKGHIAADGTPEQLLGELGSRSHVRLEAVCGDAEEARRLLLQTPGAKDVLDRGRLGIHHVFDVACETDLREDVGALAAQRGWALRELSWRKPTLESLFAGIALELDPGSDEPSVTSGGPAEAHQSAPSAGLELGLAPPAAEAAAGSGRALYNLNPFDAGAQRDLSAPKAVDPGLSAGDEREECDA